MAGAAGTISGMILGIRLICMVLHIITVTDPVGVLAGIGAGAAGMEVTGGRATGPAIGVRDTGDPVIGVVDIGDIIIIIPQVLIAIIMPDRELQAVVAAAVTVAEQLPAGHVSPAERGQAVQHP